MLHCKNSVTTAHLGTATTLNEAATAPGFFTAKTLQELLSASLQSGRQLDEIDKGEPSDEIISPYGRLPRQARKTHCRHRQNDLVLVQSGLRIKPDFVARRKRCRKLDPMPVRPQDQLKLVAAISGNQSSGGEVVPDEQRLELLRSGLLRTNSKQQRNMDRLKSDIQWIHGHFPVLKLANAKCSRTLRQQLFRTAVIHVSINFMQRKALIFWYRKLLDAQRTERLQLKASRQLIAMFEKVSFDRVTVKFNSWRLWVLECQEQEKMAAAITLQHFARFIHRCREETESIERKVALMQALQELYRNARTIQRAYRRHRQIVQQHRCEAAARKIQHIEMRRTAYNEFVRRQNSAKLLQQTYRAYSKRRSYKRSKAIAQLLDRSRDRQARRIQSTWRAYKSWCDWELPLEVVETLVDQVVFLDAVLFIQRHLRGFRCRFRMRKKNESAARIQHCWRGYKRRVAARGERQMMHLRYDMAASCLQRTFKRKREERKVRKMVRQSARPMYLRARQLGESFRERLQVPIAKSAIVMIQSTWRRHIAYKTEKQRRLVATTRIQRFLRREAILAKWRSSVLGAPRNHRNAAARTIQCWIRHLRQDNRKARYHEASAVYIVEHISAALRIQRWYRRYCCDSWRFVDRLLAMELPKCIEAVNRIARCWRAHFARKKEQVRRASILVNFIEQRRRSEVENRAARFVQRLFKRMIDRRDGKLLLHKYKILMREDIKRRQQRVLVHKYLDEKSQQRRKKQETKIMAASTKSSVDSPQMLTLVTTEASAFSLEGSFFSASDVGWQPDLSSSPITGPVQYWSDEYQRAYLYDPATGISTWL